MNFPRHYSDDHSSEWCRFHPKKKDGKPYSTTNLVNCPEQLKKFTDIMQKVANKPEEYINPAGKFTTNVAEAFHSLALKYRDKRIYLGHKHYCMKTDMAILHKNIGPIWKLLLFLYLEVDVPETAVRAVLEQQRQWRLKKAEYESQEVIKKRATQKKNRKRRLRHEKTRMDSIRATGVTTVEYVGKSMAVDQSDSSDEDETVIIEDNMASATPTVTTTPSSTVATNNASTQAAATSSTYGTGTEAGIEQVSSMQSRIFIIFDLEGTGGNTHRDSIIEIGASAYIPHRIQDLETPLEFSTLVKTSAKIKSIVAMKTGISQGMLQGKPKLSTALPSFLDWVPLRFISVWGKLGSRFVSNLATKVGDKKGFQLSQSLWELCLARLPAKLKMKLLKAWLKV
ncbi:uncharacterized protein [Ptychodera flava]|uniref:uncharacterized protein n=1 Tax=Ptychodera flava TaxID=63121 RepID=UPI00396A2296